MLLKELLDLNEAKKKKAKHKAKKVKEKEPKDSELESEDVDLEDEEDMEDEDEDKEKRIKEEKWSGDVKTKWDPPEGFFKQSSGKIASGLKSASKDLKQAMGRLNFYINRAGKNLSDDDQDKLESAKEKLHSLYDKKD